MRSGSLSNIPGKAILLDYAKPKSCITLQQPEGTFFPEEYGFGYIRALAENFYGIKECIMFKAIGLDIDGADEEQILLDCEKQIREGI